MPAYLHRAHAQAGEQTPRRRVCIAHLACGVHPPQGKRSQAREISLKRWPSQAGEMMDDAMDGAMDDGDAEDETNDVVSQARGARCGECAVRCAGRADVVARLRAGGPVQRAPHLACHPTLCTLPTHAARCMRCGLGLLQQPSACTAGLPSHTSWRAACDGKAGRAGPGRDRHRHERGHRRRARAARGGAAATRARGGGCGGGRGGHEPDGAVSCAEVARPAARPAPGACSWVFHCLLAYAGLMVERHSGSVR